MLSPLDCANIPFRSPQVNDHKSLHVALVCYLTHLPLAHLCTYTSERLLKNLASIKTSGRPTTQAAEVLRTWYRGLRVEVLCGNQQEAMEKECSAAFQARMEEHRQSATKEYRESHPFLQWPSQDAEVQENGNPLFRLANSSPCLQRAWDVTMHVDPRPMDYTKHPIQLERKVTRHGADTTLSDMERAALVSLVQAVCRSTRVNVLLDDDVEMYAM